MTNTLFVLAAIAATTCAQMGGETPINPSMLVQRDGCFWDCQYIYYGDGMNETNIQDEICYDTCTPKLSRYREYSREGAERISRIYSSTYWEEQFQRNVFNFALENEEQRTFDFLADYHRGALDNGQCWPWWRCDWSECNEEEYDGSGDECWTEYCYEDCGNEEPICKFWYAREYDYEWNQWRWDIEDCDQGFVGELSQDAMGAADFVEDNFGDSIDMIAQKVSERCPNGDCVDQSAMMAANVVANVAEDVDIDMVAGTVAGVLDMFYENDSAVEIANVMSNEGQDTFDMNVDALDFGINAQNSTNVAEQVSQTASYVFEEETQDVLEDNEAWADWIGTFVSGLMNRADERKGEREENMEWDATNEEWRNDDMNGNW